jgi:hypothetical protein
MPEQLGSYTYIFISNNIKQMFFKHFPDPYDTFPYENSFPSSNSLWHRASQSLIKHGYHSSLISISQSFIVHTSIPNLSYPLKMES